MSKDMKLFKALNDIDNNLLMDDNKEKDIKRFYVKYLKYAVASIALVVTLFGGYKLFKKESDTTTSQGDSNPTSDYQTDVKVIHPGDKEPEDENEFFVYQITPEEEEQMRLEAEEYKQKMMEEIEKNRKQPTEEEMAEMIARMDKEAKGYDQAYAQLVKEGRDMLVRINGEDVVKAYEDEEERTRSIETLSSPLAVSTGQIKLWEFWMDTIIEHYDEINNDEISILLIQINRICLEYAEENYGFEGLVEKYDYLNKDMVYNRNCYPDDVIGKRVEKINSMENEN